MYIFAILAIIISTMSMLLATGQGGRMVTNLVDVYSLLVLLIIAIPIMISCKLLKDFNNAFKIALGKGTEITLIEVRRAMEATSLMRKTLLYGGAFMFLVAMIIVLHQLNDPLSLGPNISVALLSALYGIIANLLLLPIEARLKIKMIEFIQE